MNTERVEAAALAVEREMLRLQEEGVFWRDGTEAIAYAALAAADAASGERVHGSAYWTNNRNEKVYMATTVLSSNPSITLGSVVMTLQPGEELVVRKVRGT